MNTEMDVNAQELLSLLSCAKLYLDEAIIRVGNGKAQILEVDPTHTQMMQGEIDCNSEPCLVPINLEKMIKALSAAGKDAKITVGDGILEIHGEHTRIKVPQITKEATFKWPAPFAGNPLAECELDPSLLAPMISYGQYTSSSVATFKIGDTRMKIEIGQIPDTSEIVCPATAVGETQVSVDLAYLDTIIKHVRNVPAVTVCGFGDDKPLMFRWVNGSGQYRVLVAPRIEEGEQ